MKYFKLVSPYGKMPDNEIWQGINGDSTMKYEKYVFVRKPIPSFEQVWDVFAKTNIKTEKLGCASLFYFEYYLELRDRIKEITGERKQLTANTKVLRIFMLEFLNKWLKFIKRSDNTLYPQNDVLIEIAKIAGKGQNFFDSGTTLIGITRNLHLDVSTKAFLHLAALGFQHIPFGAIIAGLLGGLNEYF